MPDCCWWCALDIGHNHFPGWHGDLSPADCCEGNQIRKRQGISIEKLVERGLQVLAIGFGRVGLSVERGIKRECALLARGLVSSVGVEVQRGLTISTGKTVAHVQGTL
jgi:hypothetical protein